MLEIPPIPNAEYKGSRIAFFGPMCSGKTFQANLLVQKFDYEKFAFADRLKEMATELFGITGKDNYARSVLQKFGQGLRDIDPNVWEYVMANRLIKRFSRNPEARVVVDDVRYPSEYKLLEDAGFLMVHAYAPLFTRNLRVKELYPDLEPERFTHPSETLLESFVGHTTLKSYGEADLSALGKLVYWTKG